MRTWIKASEDATTGFNYFQRVDTGHVYYYGGFVGKKSGLFGDKDYWSIMLTMPNGERLYGPWPFLDQAVPAIIHECAGI